MRDMGGGRRAVRYRVLCVRAAPTPTVPPTSEISMCGIAGYSLSVRSGVGPTLAAQALLAGIAERGADAAGYAYRTAAGPVSIVKQRTGATALIDQIVLPTAAAQVLLHVRDYTKGHPSIEANNHPIRHGRVVGIHNGIIVNDDELFARHGIERDRPEMTVDSEIIFALAERDRGRTAAALEELHGTMATAWLDEGRRELLLARGMGRPLWIGQGPHGLFFASTKEALSRSGICGSVSASERWPLERCSRSTTGPWSPRSASVPTWATSSPIRCRRCGRRRSAFPAWPGWPRLSPPPQDRS